MGFAEEQAVRVLAFVYAAVIFVLQNAISILFYFQRTFPQASSWITLMAGAYCAYKTARKLLNWWYSTALLVVKSFVVTATVMFGLYLYSRGLQNFIATDYPRLQQAFSYLYSMRLDGSGTAADYVKAFAQEGGGPDFTRESALDYMYLWKAAHDGWDNVNSFMLEADPDGKIQDSVNAFFKNRAK